MHSQAIFGDGIFATRKLNGQSGSPEPPLISDYPQSQCTSFIYNDFNTLKLKYKIDGQWVKKTAEGRYWKKIVKMNDIPGRPRDWVSPADINETMRAAVIASSGKVLSGEDRQLVFYLEDEVAGHLWATLWPQDGKYTIKIIQEKSMEQVLVFDVDTMMARLDALGVLTLEGIFFDTAKASLRTESDEALSGVQIRHNYLQAVKDFGGTILAEESHGLYFRLDNLDGSSTYVSVWAPGSKYQVTAVTPSIL